MAGELVASVRSTRATSVRRRAASIPRTEEFLAVVVQTVGGRRISANRDATICCP